MGFGLGSVGWLGLEVGVGLGLGLGLGLGVGLVRLLARHACLDLGRRLMARVEAGKRASLREEASRPSLFSSWLGLGLGLG